MAESIVESIKLVGGLAGLGTLTFTIFDRFIRGRPWATVDRAVFLNLPDPDRLELRIFNTSPRPILVQSIETAPPWKVAPDNSVKGAALSMTGERFSAIIEG